MLKIHRQGQSTRWMLLWVLLALAALLAACGDSNSANTPSAQTLIQQAQTAIQQAKSYHFTLNTENPGQSSGGITIKTADGDIVVPDKLQAKVGAVYSGIAVNTQVVAIGNDQYLKNPLTDQWEKQNNLLDPRLITSSDTGIAALLGNIQNPSTPQDSTVNNTPCWSIGGKLDTKYIGSITGVSGLSGQMVDTTVCIGKTDYRPYQIIITGKALQGDLDNTKRTFTLSKFDETLNITAPI